MNPENTTSISLRRAKAKYAKTDRGKAMLKRYKTSVKGKAAQIRADEKRKTDPDRLEKNREYARAFRARQKAKQEIVIPSESPETDKAKQERRRAYQREWARRKREEKRKTSRARDQEAN